MTIINKMAEALYIELCKPHLEETTAIKRAAQAAWDIVKADMLGDDVVFAAVDGRNTQKNQRERDKVISTLTAAMQKMEE